jgi:hypothetical protein
MTHVFWFWAQTPEATLPLSTREQFNSFFQLSQVRNQILSWVLRICFSSFRYIDVLSSSALITHQMQASSQGATYSKLTPLDGVDSAISYAVPLANTSSTFGVLAVVMFSRNIDNYLSTNFANATDGRVVFIMDHDGDLVGTSVRGLAYETAEFGMTKSVNVRNCSNQIIRKAGVFALSMQDTPQE